MKISKIIMFVGGVETLDYFSMRMGEEYKRMGYQVFYYDLQDVTAAKKVRKYIRSKETIMITFNFEGLEQENGIYEPSRGYLWQQLGVPCYNIVADHPYFYHDRLENLPRDYHHISIDKNHRAYLRKYYPKYDDFGFLPLAGTPLCSKEEQKLIADRNTDVLLVGNYTTLSFFEPHIEWINEEYAQFYRGIIKDLTAETDSTVEAMEERHCNRELGETQLDELRSAFHKMTFIDLYIRNYYRGAVVQMLVDAGIEVTVIGKGWDELPCEQRENLTILPQTDSIACLQAMKDAKIALNVMPWFKDGAHDRIFNGILNGCVSVSDTSKYLSEQLPQGMGVWYYQLSELEQMPQMITELLEDNDKLQHIVDTGYNLVKEKHTWEQRAHELLEMIKLQCE